MLLFCRQPWQLRTDSQGFYLLLICDNRYYEKVGNNTPVCIDDEISEFELPEGWKFAKISALLKIQTGASFKKDSATTNPKLVRVLRGGNILNGSYNFFDNDIYLDNNLVSDAILLQRNDLITPAVTSIENIGKIARIEQTYNNVTAGGFVFILRPYYQIDELSKYLLYALQSSYFNKQLKAITKKSGQAFYNLGKERLLQLILPIPPLAEQARIVAEIEKFEPLIAEYDKLEQQATKLDDEIYDKLKKSILQYAIQGKLVPQDPNDEPASVLLECIRAEKKAKLGKKYVDSYIYKGDDNCYYEKVGINEPNRLEDLPFDIPDSWCWARLENTVIINPRNDLSDNIEVSFVEMKAISDGYNNQFTATTRHWKAVKSGFTHFQDNDVGFAKITPCFQNRKSVVFSSLQNAYGAGTTELHILRPILGTVLSKYLLCFVKSPYLIEHGKRKFSGTAGQQRFGTDEVKKTLFPLPPLAEQERIVKQVKMILAKLKGED